MSGLKSFGRGCSVVAWLLLFVPSGRGQILITEAMSFGSTMLVGGIPWQRPDFWELTNYGGEKVDLSGYRFNDANGGLWNADSAPFTGLTLSPSESLLVVKGSDPTVDGRQRFADSFRQIWGLSNSVQVTVYTAGNGLSSLGDRIRLWESSNGGLVDEVEFGVGSVGRTFTRDPQTGRFGFLSVEGIGGAYRAPNSPEVGSPGIAPERISMRITRQPQSVTANPGDAARFEVGFHGLPVPSCRWYFNNLGNLIGTGEILDFAEVSPANEGTYWAVIDDGVSTVTSTPATLKLNQQPSAPRLLQMAGDLQVFVGQQASFEVVATGLPRPSFQWFYEGAEIDGARERRFVLPDVRLEDAGHYSVVASNPVGSVTNEVLLSVSRPPRLKITEVMALSNTNRLVEGHGDWWEFTNFDDHPVDLYGYRFATLSGNSPPSLKQAWRNPNHLLIHPGESVVFLEDMDADEFRRWWGDLNLPSDLQIVTYHGDSLGFNASIGDVLWVWNPGATTDMDYLDGVDFQGQFEARSYAYDPGLGEFIGNSSGQSLFGVNGAVAAAMGGEVGSPGYVDSAGRVILRIALEAQGIRLRWRGLKGRNYRLESAQDFGKANWRFVARLPGKADEDMDYLASTVGRTKAFFRVVVEP